MGFEAMARVNAIPLLTSASRWGVLMKRLPRAWIVSGRWSSLRISSTFGRCGFDCPNAGSEAAIVTNLEPGEVLFIDEIHRLTPAVEEILYPAMEDFKLDLIIGQGPSARTVKLDLPRFTLIGATTRAGLLTAPLRDRFGVIAHLAYYPPEDLEKILVRSAGILEVPLEVDGAREIARRSRGTPRVANRLLRRVRDYAQVEAQGTITLEIARYALEQLEVDWSLVSRSSPMRMLWRLRLCGCAWRRSESGPPRGV